MQISLYYFNLFEESAYIKHHVSRNRAIENSPLDRLLEKIKASTPSVLLLDGLELLSSDVKWAEPFDPTEYKESIERKLASLNGKSVCVLATHVDQSTLPDSFQVSIEPHKLFGTCLELSMPDLNQRKEVLTMFYDHYRFDNKEFAGFIDQASRITTGLGIRDIDILMNETSLIHSNLLTQFSSISITNQNQSSAKSQLLETFKSRLKSYQPLSNTDEFQFSKPNLDWNSFGGYKHLINDLKRLALWPLDHPQAFKRFGIKPPSGVLLYGPTGCGKTMLVNTLASNVPMNFISVKTNQIFSKYLGESERKIRSIFQLAVKSKPCILFIDNIDAIACRREWHDSSTGVDERVLSSLLNEMDGVGELAGVLVVACTNQVSKLDDALTRPGRFDVHMSVDLPTDADRKDIFEMLTKTTSLKLTDDEIDELVLETSGFSGADICVLVREAGMIALSISLESNQITMKNVKESLSESRSKNGCWKPGAYNVR